MYISLWENSRGPGASRYSIILVLCNFLRKLTDGFEQNDSQGQGFEFENSYKI